MPPVSIYLPKDLHEECKKRYSSLSTAAQELFAKDLESIKPNPTPKSISFQLRVLAERVENMERQ